MNRDIAVNIALFFAAIILQVLIFNHIALFNVAIPFVFIIFFIRLPIDLNLNFLYTFAFLSGFLVDIFSDTPGVNTLSCMFTAAMKRPIFFVYVTRDDKTVGLVPSLSTLGWAVYSKYLVTITALFCLLNFSIEYFSFASVKEIIVMTAASTALTFVLILACDSLVGSRRDRQ